jgi:hypothetical protein
VGVHTEVYNKPENARFLELYIQGWETEVPGADGPTWSYQLGLARQVQAGSGLADLTTRPTSDDEAVQARWQSTHAAVEELRSRFQQDFSPLERAMLLGDHHGQGDPAKYLAILSNVKANADASAYDLFFGPSRILSVEGVFKAHADEQQLLDPDLGARDAQGFQAGLDWLRQSDPEQPGLFRAVLADPELRVSFDRHRGQGAVTYDTFTDWLRELPIKSNGASTPELTRIQQVVAAAYYDYSVLQPTRSQFDLMTAEAAPVSQAVPDSRPPGQRHPMIPPSSSDIPITELWAPTSSRGPDVRALNLEDYHRRLEGAGRSLNIEGSVELHFQRILLWLREGITATPELEFNCRFIMDGVQRDLETLRQGGLDEPMAAPIIDRLQTVMRGFDQFSRQTDETMGDGFRRLGYQEAYNAYQPLPARNDRPTRPPSAPPASASVDALRPQGDAPGVVPLFPKTPPPPVIHDDSLPMAAERGPVTRRSLDLTDRVEQAVRIGTPLTAVGAMLMRGLEGTSHAAEAVAKTAAEQDPGFWSDVGRAATEYGSQYGPVAGLVLGGALVLLGAKHFLRPSHAPIAPPDSSPSPPPQPKPDAAQPQASPASPQKGDPLARSGTHLVSPFAETLPAGLAATMGPRTGAVTPERGLRLLLTGTGN